jgi:hypothetical protein
MNTPAQPPYEYSAGDKIEDDDGTWGVVMYADPERGGVVRWDDGEETDYTWHQLGMLPPQRCMP